MTAFFQSPDGRKLAYQDQGSGPIVLCLAGLTRDSRDFRDLADHLSVRYRVLRLDSRGRGESEWAQNPLAEYQVPVEAQDALALLDHLSIEKTLIVGTSRGGLLSMGMAAAAPGRISGLVLNDIGPFIEPLGLEAIMGYLGINPGWGSFSEAVQAMSRTLSPAFPDLTGEQWMAFARNIYADDEGVPRLSYDPRLRDAVAAGLEQPAPDLWPLFDTLTETPMLVIRGARSNILSAETLAEMIRRKPDIAHVTLENRGHVPFLDEPDAKKAIDRFLKENAT